MGASQFSIMIPDLPDPALRDADPRQSDERFWLEAMVGAQERYCCGDDPV